MSLSSVQSLSSPSSWICQCVDKILHSWPFCYETRNGMIECPCGKVQYRVKCPPSSYGIIEQTNAICHCNDCINFAIACPNYQHVITKNYGTHLIQFYTCDIRCVRGHACGGNGDINITDDATDISPVIGAVKIREGTPLLRIYCKECGTPIGAQVPAVGVCLVYEQVLKQYPICFLPSLVLGYKDRLLGKTKPYSSSSVTVRQSTFGFIFLCRVIGRVILGLILGKKLVTASCSDDDDGNAEKSHEQVQQQQRGLWPFEENAAATSMIPVGLEAISSRNIHKKAD